MLSEFGAMRNADEMSRQAFYVTYVEEALRAGFTFHVWDDGGDIGLLNRRDGIWPDEIDLLIHAVPDGPTDLRVIDDQPVALACKLLSPSDSVLVERRRPGSAFVTPMAMLSADARSITNTTAIGGQAYPHRVATRSESQPDAPSCPVQVAARPTRRAPFGVAPSAVSGTIQAEDFDEGGEGLSYHDSTPDNIPGANRTNVAVDIEPRDDGGYQISEVASGEWIEYTIDVAEAGTYEVSIYVATELGGGRLRLSVGDMQGEFLRTTTTGSGQTLAPIGTTLPLEAGEQILRLNLLTARPNNVDRLEIQPMTGIDDEPGAPDQTFRIYPNPAPDRVVVEMDSDHGDGSRDVFNVLGQRVRTVELAPGIDPIVRVRYLASGTYLHRATVRHLVVGEEVFIKP